MSEQNKEGHINCFGLSLDEQINLLDHRYSMSQSTQQTNDSRNLDKDLLFADLKIHTNTFNSTYKDPSLYKATFVELNKILYEHKREQDELDEIISKYSTLRENIWKDTKPYIDKVNKLEEERIKNENQIKSLWGFEHMPTDVEPLIEINEINFINTPKQGLKNVQTIKSNVTLLQKHIDDYFKPISTNIKLAKVNVDEKVNNNSANNDELIEILEKSNVKRNTWTYQYQDERLIGIDTDEPEVKDPKLDLYNWIRYEINQTNANKNFDYFTTLNIYEAYIEFMPDYNIISSTKWALNIFENLKDSIINDCLDIIIYYFTGLNSQTITYIDHYCADFINKKMQDWLNRKFGYLKPKNTHIDDSDITTESKTLINDKS